MSRRSSLLHDPRARFGLAVLVLAILVAVLAPLLAVDPSLQRDIVATRFLPPLSTDLHGAFHLLGTDRFGRDVWSRLVFGARVSLGVGVLAVLLSVVIGHGGGSRGRLLAGSRWGWCCWGSPTSPWRSPAWCCCCCSPRCGSRARRW